MILEGSLPDVGTIISCQYFQKVTETQLTTKSQNWFLFFSANYSPPMCLREVHVLFEYVITGIILNTLSAYRFYVEVWVSKYFSCVKGVQRVKPPESICVLILEGLRNRWFSCQLATYYYSVLAPLVIECSWHTYRMLVMLKHMVNFNSYFALSAIVSLIAQFWISKGLILHWSDSL